jgi:hypothetical protein
MRKLLFKRLSPAKYSPFVALIMSTEANPMMLGIVHENDMGWAMYNDRGCLVTDVYQTSADLQKTVAREYNLEVY